MRIALIVPGAGGFSRNGHKRDIPVLSCLIERLARRHEVLVIALDEQHRHSYHLLGATVATLGHLPGPGRAGRWLVGLRRLISALRVSGGRFDVLHAFWAGREASLTVVAGRLLRVPVVVSIGGGELVWLPEVGYGSQGTWSDRAKIALTLRAADAASAGSWYGLRSLAQLRSDARWLPWGVDWRSFDAPVERPPGPPWRLLQVASLNRVKDQSTLLRAVRLVLDRGLAVKLDCIGEDTLDGAIERAAVRLGLDGAVRFHGFKPLEAIAPFYRQAHLFVQSSLHESMGAGVLEAAAAGVPTVGTAVGLVAEMGPEAAFAVPVSDPEALARAISTLIVDERQRLRLGRAAQRFARTYDCDWTAEQFESVYSMLRTKRTAGSS
jgi:glycosyltransferase involved in cell wall biosynthesis